ncbi:hypothetical protein BKA82DRAFT_1004165 [Pisolithus tinctorius]|uniref:Alcohol dehydrogenase-like N-terminal domain-containing protein n=1 Tax=Pisolithus tinctorius Marx 270 TaxID=870435 RepID=A0A0C3JRB3_PISTI|nr:hypothetical protein BKA82DRAFT_1004165 [Pisolithus tinctorius]KIO00022.1 hypothetical protein M404DRAFT_1004165 [Pisolithus tinctorius Marx 270]
MSHATELLVAYCRDQLMDHHRRYGGVANDLVLCSGREGEVVAVGVDVKRWKVGDCVCSNFVLEHVCGDLTQEIKASALGGDTDCPWGNTSMFLLMCPQAMRRR